MDDKKSTAIAIGVVAGVVLAGTAVALYLSRSHEQPTHDINQIVEQARQTVHKLEEAVDFVRKSAVPEASKG